MNESQCPYGLVKERILIETGLASIQGSRKSIEKAASARRLTHIASVFIPLTHATSLLGMDIKELNESGKWLRTFLVSVYISSLTPVMTLIRSKLAGSFYIRVKRCPKNPPHTDWCCLIYGFIILGSSDVWWMLPTEVFLSIFTGEQFGSGFWAKYREYSKEGSVVTWRGIVAISHGF